MDWISFAFRAVRAWPDIMRLQGMLKPTLAEFTRIPPEALPLAQQLVRDLFPEVAEAAAEYDVFWLQASLNKLGYKVAVDGDYGPATKEAVKKFQKACGLDVDGWAGVITTSRIYTELARGP